MRNTLFNKRLICGCAGSVAAPAAAWAIWLVVFICGGACGAAALSPVPAPLTGTVSTQTWLSFDESFSGITLASGKKFHFNVLPPAQYNGTNYKYPLYIWLHPQSEGDNWYSGSTTNATYLTNDEAADYNTVGFLTAYPAFIALPYADQTTDTSGGAVENWGGWCNSGVTGSGTTYSGDTGPNTFAVLDMITFLEGQYSIDPARIYVNGFSLGGIGSEYFMLHYNAYTGDLGRIFAAGASTGGVLQINGCGSSTVSMAQSNQMSTVPVWWFSGANDTTSYPSEWNDPMWNALSNNAAYPTAITSASSNQAGTSQMRYTRCPTCGHQDTDASGGDVWSNTTINSFLFAQASSASGESISVNTISAQAPGTQFTVTGTISGASAAPQLQYSVNGGAYQSLNPTGERVYTCQPGTNNNVWNTPIGNGATYGAATDSDTQSARVGGYINQLNNYGAAVWDNYDPHSISATFIGLGDNYKSTTNPGGTQFNVFAHVLPGSYPPGPWISPPGNCNNVPGTCGDNQYIFHDNTGVNAGIEYQFAPFGWATQASPFSSATGSGPFGSIPSGSNPGNFGGAENLLSDTYSEDWETGNGNFTQAAGLIRGCDLNGTNYIPGTTLPKIQHVLRYAHRSSSLKANSSGGTSFPSDNSTLNANSWPQLYEDYQDPAQSGNYYTGNLVYGTQLFIPSSTTMPTGLTNAGQEIFWTLQHYGSITRDQGSSCYCLYADQNVPSSWINDLNTDFPKLVALLVPMRNQHQGGQSFTTYPINGPGTRLDAGPPALAPLVQSGQITATSFSFTVPGLAASNASTISVQDVNTPSAMGTSNSFAVGSTQGPTGIKTKGDIITYLKQIQGTSILSGQFTESPPTNSNPFGFAPIQTIYNTTSKWLAFIGIDAQDGGTYGYDSSPFSSYAQNYWNNGGLIEYNWFADNPANCDATETGSCQHSAGDFTKPAGGWSDIYTSGTTANTNWISQMNAVATDLQQYQNAGIPVMFRPFVEMNGNWNWWAVGSLPCCTGGSGITAAQFIALWQYTWNYLTNTKGLNNLDWIYAANACGNLGSTAAQASCEGATYPGNSYVDILGYDIYSETPGSDTTGDYGYFSGSGFGGKPIFYAEFGAGQTADLSFPLTTLITQIQQNTPNISAWQQWWSGGDNFGMELLTNTNALTSALSSSAVITRGEINCTSCTGSGPPTPSTTTWNPNDTSGSITLSNGYLTATGTAVAVGGSRSSTSYSSGSQCEEVQVNTVTTDMWIGIANSTYALAGSGTAGYDTNAIGFYPSSGNPQGIFFNGTKLSSGTNPDANGDAVTMCQNFATSELWVSTPSMRALGQTWNSSTSANPATGVGGNSFSGLNCPCFITWGTQDTGSQVTLNPTGPFAISTPSGFVPWQASTTTANNLIFIDLQ